MNEHMHMHTNNHTHAHTTHITSISPLAFLLPYTMCTYIPSEHFLILYTHTELILPVTYIYTMHACRPITETECTL